MNVNHKISIVVVSYNVREFLYQCLLSVQRATTKLDTQIFVVDNASVDGSVQMVKRHYPDVILMENKENVGFAAANNQALQLATGEFLVLLNPDTIVQEDTFKKLLSFFDNTPDAGAAGCKILNPDGSFSIDSRHSIPSPMTAIWKMLGLNRLFPKSKIFGRYNMTYLDPDETSQVDAISGSFMMIRRKVYHKIGGLDNDYFMYCEDIDFCYRISQEGWNIYYVPETSIIHYKGESTKKNKIDNVINFNRSLYLFYKKHFQHHYLSFFRWFILLGVMLRGIIVFIRNFISANFALLIDLFLMNSVYTLTFFIRYEMGSGFSLNDFFNQYIYINIISTLIFIASAYFLELYGKYKLSLIQIFKTNFSTLLLLSALTFFINQLAFSRIVVIVAASFSTALMIIWRIIFRLLGSRSGSTFSKSFFQRRIVLVGTDEETAKLIQKMKAQVPADYVIVGVISDSTRDIGKNIEEIPIVSDIKNMGAFIRLENIDEVIFSTHKLSYQTVISTMSIIDNPGVEFKIVPENLEVIIGKSSIENVPDYQLVEIDLPLGKIFNKITKRAFDVSTAILLTILASPALVFYFFLPKNSKQKYEMYDIYGNRFYIHQGAKDINTGVLNKILLFPLIIIGKLSFVGASITVAIESTTSSLFKPGLTGLAQINSGNNPDTIDAEKYDLYYARNQSFWLDVEIILKSIFS